MENIAENKLNRVAKDLYLKEGSVKHNLEMLNLKLEYIFEA